MKVDDPELAEIATMLDALVAAAIDLIEALAKVDPRARPMVARFKRDVAMVYAEHAGRLGTAWNTAN